MRSSFKYDELPPQLMIRVFALSYVMLFYVVTLFSVTQQLGQVVFAYEHVILFKKMHVIKTCPTSLWE